MSDALTNDIRQEANTALLEVDKGLRSARVGDQCEAIVKFPSLVERFPFPILINAAFLKLAEVFRTGINFLRLNILKVFQLSEKHITKITNVDEFLRRIYAVIHSNDPVARAVTLRVFGSIACIIAERKNVHHSIHQGLESNDQVEVEAAIYATSCLCRHSATFASSVCEKIASMVQGLTTPIGLKLRLIPILTLMRHDIAAATKVRELCLKLLPSYPSLSFVTTILKTLTTLATETLVHVPSQVQLLICYAQSDTRKAIRLTALRELLSLVSEVPHTWTVDMVHGLLSTVERAALDREKEVGLFALYKLSASQAVHNTAPFKDQLLPYCYSDNVSIAAYAMGAVTNITIATSGVGGALDSSTDIVEVGSIVIESLVVMEIGESNNSSKHCDNPFKVILSSLVQLASINNQVSSDALDVLLDQLSSLHGAQGLMLCQTLVSIAARASSIWDQVTPKLLNYLDSKVEDHHEILLPVSAVLMQIHSGEATAAQMEHFHTSVLHSLLSYLWSMKHPSHFWVAYKIARKASMMGFHHLSEPIYKKLSKTVSTVKYRHWLGALHQFSWAQCLLLSSQQHAAASISDLIPALCRASAIIYDAMMLAKASCPPSSFPFQLLTVLAAWLNAHCQLLTTCVGLHTLPPPTNSMGGSLEKKFRQCVSQFQSLSGQVYDLYSSLFDADPATLDYINFTRLQQGCLLMASVISFITLSRKPLVSPGRVSTPVSETPVDHVEISDNFNTDFLLGKVCRNVYHHAQVAAGALQSLPVGEQHGQVLSECSKMLLNVPITLPSYFFIALQRTTVKLALSPPLPSPGQHVTVHLNSHLSLKVEGVIEHSGRAKLYRSPQGVYVQVEPKLEKLLSHDEKAPELKPLERTESIDMDYFQAQFLLTLPAAGYYTVHIKASLLDNEGRVWHTGYQPSMTVLVDSEENLRQHQRQREAAAVSTAKGSSGSGGVGSGASSAGGGSSGHAGHSRNQ